MPHLTTADGNLPSHFASISNRWFTKRPIRSFVILFLLLVFIIELSGYKVWPLSIKTPVLLPGHDYHQHSPLSSNLSTPSKVCDGYLKDAGLVVVVKTGATEASRKIPWQLVSFLSCAKDDLFFFSDLEQDIGDIHLHDALENIAEDAKFNNTEFKLYEDQKKFVLEGQDLGRLSGRAAESWKLDKYKNIHIAQRVWQMRPKQSWYFFIDADTYVVWPSLFALLKQYDPNKKIYLGAEVNSDPHFAHGGSGYALSRRAMEVLVGGDAKQIANSFDVKARAECCGDIELSKTLLSKDIKVTDAHPMINGDKPNNYRLGPKLWCKPLVTMHHIGAEEMNDLWQFERSRMSPETPLLFEELWTNFLEPKMATRRADWAKLSDDEKQVAIPAERDDWENFSENITIEPPRADNSEKIYDDRPLNPSISDAYESSEKCAKTCKETSDCFQYMYSNQKCQLSHSFRFGQQKEPDGENRWKSGWDLEKIKEFKAKNSPCGRIDFKSYPQ